MEVKTAQKTIKEIIADGERFLSSKGNENARGEAETLIAFGLGLARVDLYLSFDKPLAESELQKLRGYFKSRTEGKPLQHITGESVFRYLKLKVNDKTFIPRPETELITELVLNIIKKGDNVLELGTGSGAIALSIAKEGEVKVDATDVSKDALKMAKANGKLNEVDGVKWLESNWYENISNKYNVIVSNPPYVSLEEYNSLPKEINEYEPEIAVTDNNNGFKCLKEIISKAPGFLEDKGHLILEIGYDQQEGVDKLLKKSGFIDIRFEKDLTGKIRFAVASFEGTGVSGTE